MAELNADARALIDEPNLAHLVTLMKDGSPQVTPLWVDHDGTHVIVNTAEGRQKPRNLRRDPRVAISIIDRNNGQRTLQVRGRVVEMVTGAPAWQSIDRLASKYRGAEVKYPRREGEERILIKTCRSTSPTAPASRPSVRR
jgi:PPOX class probable F420-dependent enzyme